MLAGLLALAASGCSTATDLEIPAATSSVSSVPPSTTAVSSDPVAEAPPEDTVAEAPPEDTVAEAPPEGTVAPEPGAGLTVVSVTDGDTFRVVIDGVEERVRLVGIDTPEAGECMADEARLALERYLDVGEITLLSDESDRDQYGRLLRMVQTPDGPVNARLVDDGLAIARSYPPDTLWDDELAEAQVSAQDRNVGLWDPAACGEPPDVSIEIVEIQHDPPGNDTEVLNQEWVKLVSVGSEAVDMTGWVLRDESASKRFAFPNGFVIEPNQPVTIHSGCGTASASDLYWCVSGSAVWNNNGDTAFLLDPAGNFHTTRSY